MSGTSLDGVDLVYVSFDNDDYSDFEMIFFETIPYTSNWKEKLKNAIDFSKDKLIDLDEDYGNYLGEIINSFKNKFKINKVDFIASHGHTIFHQPERKFTFQIGSGKGISRVTNNKVVCDFRTQDVLLGGQGAPLVPIGDQLLFSKYCYCINLGGFANVSFDKNGERIAFDICPVNIVLNYYSNKLDLEYDEFGEIAASGKINLKLLNHLNSLEFYKLFSPKSLGLEWVVKEVFPLIDSLENSISNILRTFVEHIAIQISKIVNNNKSVLYSGGGVYNSFLISRIEFFTKTQIRLPKKNIINFKEALIFSLLGLLKIKEEINCLKSVTGAQKNHSSGVIFNP